MFEGGALPDSRLSPALPGALAPGSVAIADSLLFALSVLCCTAAGPVEIKVLICGLIFVLREELYLTRGCLLLSLVHWLQALWLLQTRCSLHFLCFVVLGDQARDPLGSPVLPVPLLLPEIDLWCQGTVAERNRFGYFVSTGNF